MNFFTVLGLLLKSLVPTIEIFAFTLLGALPLGLLIAFGRMSKNKIVSAIFRFYISVMRGTPLMLQLFVVFFGPYYLFGISLRTFGTNWRMIATIIGFILNYAAYFAEIYRSGIESMPIGQYEASKVLGYNRFQTFIYIILPQVVRRILPTVTNEVITLVKDTSLAFSIGVVEMFTEAKQLAAGYTSLIPFAGAGLFYYVFNLIVAYGMEYIEKRMNKYTIK